MSKDLFPNFHIILPNVKLIEQKILESKHNKGFEKKSAELRGGKSLQFEKFAYSIRMSKNYNCCSGAIFNLFSHEYIFFLLVDISSHLPLLASFFFHLYPQDNKANLYQAYGRPY